MALLVCAWGGPVAVAQPVDRSMAQTAVSSPGSSAQSTHPTGVTAAVAGRFADPVLKALTPGMAEGRTRFTTHAELQDWLQGLAREETPSTATQRPRPQLLRLGSTALAQPIWALHFAGGAPGASPRPTALLVAQQHGDEPAGAEALLLLAQELAQGQHNALLQQWDVVLLPRANPDGALAGARFTAAGRDMNRDHLLLQSTEARTVAALVQRLQPLLVVDLHEYVAVGRWFKSFGAEARHDLLLQPATSAHVHPRWQELGLQVFLPAAQRALAAQGLRSELFHSNSSDTRSAQVLQRLQMGSVQTEVARNVYGAQHGVSLLLESRGIGLGRAHLQRRVHSHLVALHALLATALEQGPALQALREQTRAETAAAACQGTVTVLTAHRPGQRELLFLDPETGADQALQVPWEDALQRVDLTQRSRPCGYWLAADAGAAVQRLQLLGLQVQRLSAALPLELEHWVEKSPSPALEPAGRRLRRADVELQALSGTAPAGSWWLPLAQPLANLAVAALEPDAPISYFANGLLQRLDQAARVMAPPKLP